MALLGSQIQALPGYPQQWGTKNVTVAEMAGPTSYVTGGQVIKASTFGWGCFDKYGASGLSYSGTYSYQVLIQPTNLNPSTQNQAVTSFKLKWIVVSTGNEVANATNLSGEIVRLEVWSN